MTTPKELTELAFVLYERILSIKGSAKLSAHRGKGCVC
jgi:hypothetical protein